MRGLHFLRDACTALATQLISHLKCRLCFHWGVLAREREKKTFIWSWSLVSAFLCVFLRACPRMMLLACSVCVWQQLHVWLQLEYVCCLNSACVCVCVATRLCVFARWNGMHVYRVAERGWVAACRDDGIGKRSLSLRPTAKPAGDAAAISSLSPPSPSISLARQLCFLLSPIFFLTLEYIFLSSFPYLSRNLFLCSPRSSRLHLLMFSRLVSYLSCFLCIHLSPRCVFVFLLLLEFPLFTPLTASPPSQTKCVSNWN